jgi:integrase
VFRKTCATLLDEGELSARQIADQLGHAKVSMTQNSYLGRRLTNRRTAEALDRALGPTLGQAQHTRRTHRSSSSTR